MLLNVRDAELASRHGEGNSRAVGTHAGAGDQFTPRRMLKVELAVSVSVSVSVKVKVKVKVKVMGALSGRYIAIFPSSSR